MSKELEQAELLFKQFKHKEAYPLFEKLADAGGARAMYFMGIYSRLYLGVGHFDQEKSYNWFKKGMEAGDVLCAMSLHWTIQQTAISTALVLRKTRKRALPILIRQQKLATGWLCLTRQHSMMKAATEM